MTQSINANIMNVFNFPGGHVACDRCIAADRKCAPPFPCTGCNEAQVPCRVRSDPRPSRKRRSSQDDWAQSTDSSARANFWRDHTTGYGTSTAGAVISCAMNISRLTIPSQTANTTTSARPGLRFDPRTSFSYRELCLAAIGTLSSRGPANDPSSRAREPSNPTNDNRQSGSPTGRNSEQSSPPFSGPSTTRSTCTVTTTAPTADGPGSITVDNNFRNAKFVKQVIRPEGIITSVSPSGPAHSAILELVNEYTVNELDYEIRITLDEPQPQASTGQSILQRLQSKADVQCLQALDFQAANDLISHTPITLGEHIDVLDVNRLYGFVRHLFPSQKSNENLLSIGNFEVRLPLDSLALLFAALAAASVQQGNLTLATALFEVSDQCTGEFAGTPTFDTVLTLFLHHVYLLHVGATGRIRRVIDQAIQIAHKLKFNTESAEKPNDVRVKELHMYLILGYVDQYCAMSLNYGPRIRYSDLSIQMFQRLLEAHPKLETTVELLRKGSKIIERIGSVQSRDSSDHDLKMEVNIGRVCLRAGAAKTPAHPDTTLDSLVRTHLFWLKLCLRMLFLPSDEHWVPSISVCARSAQMILNTYFTLLTPQINNSIRLAYGKYPPPPPHLATQSVAPDIPSSWGQVQRTMVSALVMFYAFWAGECSHVEVAHTTAITLVLLRHHHNATWEQHLDGSRRLMLDLIHKCHIQVEPAIQALVPDLSYEELYSLLNSLFQRPAGENRHDGGHILFEDRLARDEATAAVDVATCNARKADIVPSDWPRMSWEPAPLKPEADDTGMLAAVLNSSSELGLVGTAALYRDVNFWV